MDLRHKHIKEIADVRLTADLSKSQQFSCSVIMTFWQATPSREISAQLPAERDLLLEF